MRNSVQVSRSITTSHLNKFIHTDSIASFLLLLLPLANLPQGNSPFTHREQQPSPSPLVSSPSDPVGSGEIRERRLLSGQQTEGVNSNARRGQFGRLSDQSASFLWQTALLPRIEHDVFHFLLYGYQRQWVGNVRRGFRRVTNHQLLPSFYVFLDSSPLFRCSILFTVSRRFEYRSVAQRKLSWAGQFREMASHSSNIVNIE